MRTAFASKISLLASNAAAVLTRGSTGASNPTALSAAMQPGAGAAATASATASMIRLPVQHMAFATSASSSTDGPVYLVFGATGGIGSALAHRLAKSNTGFAPSSLILSAAHEDKLKELHSKLGADSRCKVDLAAADATDPQQVENVVRRVVAKCGRIDGVVNCVGNVAAASTLATELQQLEEEIKVNLYTSFNIVKSSIKAMVQEEAQKESGSSSSSNAARAKGGGGSIVLVSAALASHGIPNYESMSAAKAGVEGLARSAAATYAGHNIRINCVAPGLTRTPQTKKFTENKSVSGASEQMHPLKELAEPHQIAAALEFFLSPENDFITGQVLAVDGGLSTLHPHKAQDYGV